MHIPLHRHGNCMTLLSQSNNVIVMLDNLQCSFSLLSLTKPLVSKQSVNLLVYQGIPHSLYTSSRFSQLIATSMLKFKYIQAYICMYRIVWSTQSTRHVYFTYFNTRVLATSLWLQPRLHCKRRPLHPRKEQIN